MRQRQSHHSFIDDLKKKMKSLKDMKEGEMHVFTINANYGRYKIVVGPIRNDHDCPVEIEGEIHHLFVSPNGISANPSRSQVQRKLKDTVIMRDLSVHLNDPSGSGRNLSPSKDEVRPRECINLAGRKGDEILRKAERHGRLSMKTYNIVQKDILRSLELEEKKSRRN